MSTRLPYRLRRPCADNAAPQHRSALPEAILGLLMLLGACGGGPTESERASEHSPEKHFELVEATLADVHAALAGEQLLADGSTLSCEKLAQMYIDRILAYNDHPQPNGGRPIRGALYINPQVINQAIQLDQLYAQDSGPGSRSLHCMPVLLKDNYDTVDHPSTSGSYAMLGHQAGVDAHSVAGLRQAGALILGKANQDEFAFFTTGFSARAIQVSNPYNTAESPAGSSSGTGAAIAANFALGGTGSDTCQSIRHPSSVNGLVGIRPSVGVISQHGIFPLSHARDTGGPMTRTVRDAALMLEAMASVDPRDPKTLEFPADQRPSSYGQFLDREKHGVAGRNIGVLRQLGNNTSPAGTGAQAELMAAAIDDLKALGANIFDIYLPNFQSRGAGSAHFDMNDYFNVFESEGGTSARRCVSSSRATSSNDRADCRLDQGIVESLRVGPRSAALMLSTGLGDPDRDQSADELQAIADERAKVTSIMDNLVDEQGEAVLDERGQRVRLDAFILSPGPSGGRTCDLGSTTQMGSIVVPIGVDPSVGVPRGMEIFVRRFDEATAIGIAYDYEQATLHRFPPDIVPSPLTAFPTLQAFNAAQQQALMTATSVAPEDVDLETYLEALIELLGPVSPRP
nr:hypothetical protein [Oceanococcus sp. HetDA_MAG_MS8]